MSLFSKRKKRLPTGAVASANLQGLGSRDSQQDSYAVVGKDCGENGMLAVVADGMGGLVNSGQLSAAAVTAITEAYAPGASLAPKEQLFLMLKQAILRAEELTRGKNYPSGTTLSACMIQQNCMNWVSLGDSRVYLWRGGGLIQMNRDHDFARDLAIMTLADQLTWKEMNSNPRREALTSYIGADFPRYVDFNAEPVSLLRGDKIILMTDGVYRALSELEMSECLEQPPVKCAAMMKKKILDKHLPQQDNFTAVILEIR